MGPAEDCQGPDGQSAYSGYGGPLEDIIDDLLSEPRTHKFFRSTKLRAGRVESGLPKISGLCVSVRVGVLLPVIVPPIPPIV